MSKESVPQPIDALINKQARLTDISLSRKTLFEAVGTGAVNEGDSNVATLKIIRTKRAVSRSIVRIDSSIKAVNTEISYRQEDLISQAQIYLQSIENDSRILEEIREGAKEGLIKQATLGKHEEELQRLKNLALVDEVIKCGLDLLRRKEEEGIAQRQLPVVEKVAGEKLKIDVSSKQISFKGKSLKLTEIPWKVLVHLAKHTGKEVSYKKIAAIAKKAGSKSQTPSGDAAGSLRKFLSRIGLENALTTLGARHKARYVFNLPVEIISAEEAGEKEQTLPDGAKVELSGMRAKLLVFLLKGTEKKPVLASKLCKAFWRKDNKVTRTRLSVLLSNLKKDLVTAGWEVVMPLTKSQILKGEDAMYFLRKIKITEEPVQTKPAREISYLPIEEFQALAYFVREKSPEVDGVLRIIGPQTNHEDYLSRPQAFKMMLSAARHLYRIIERGDPIPYDQALWKEIKEGMKRTKDADALETFKATVGNWFKGERAGFEEEIKQIDEIEKAEEIEFSNDEKALLAAVYFVNSSKVNELGFDLIEEEKASKLLETFKDFESLDKGFYFEIRRAILNRVKSIVEKDDINEVILNEDDSTKDLLLYFMIHGRDNGIQFIDYLANLDIEGDEIARELLFIKEKASVQDRVQENLGVIAGVEYDFGQDKKKLSALEKLDPNIVKHSEEIVNEVFSELGGDAYYYRRITKAFPFLKNKSIKWYMNEGYANAIQGRDGHHPMFDPCEIAIMIYVSKYGEHINKRHLKFLRKVVTEVCKKKRTEIGRNS